MPKIEDLSRSLEINAIWTFDTEFPTIFNKSCTYITIDARMGKHACMVPLSIVIVATYLYLSTTAHFKKNSDFSDFTQKCNFSVNYKVNCLKLLE